MVLYVLISSDGAIILEAYNVLLAVMRLAFIFDCHTATEAGEPISTTATSASLAVSIVSSASGTL